MRQYWFASDSGNGHSHPSLCQIRLSKCWLHLTKNQINCRPLGGSRKRCCSTKVLSHPAREKHSWSWSEESISSKQPDHVIQSAIQRARTANHKLNKIQWLEKAGLFGSTLNDPHIARVLNRPIPIGCAAPTQNSNAMQLMSAPGAKHTLAPPDRL